MENQRISNDIRAHLASGSESVFVVSCGPSHGVNEAIYDQRQRILETSQHLSQTLPIPSNPRGIADARKLARAEAQKRKRERRKEAEALQKTKQAETNREYRESCGPSHGVNETIDDQRQLILETSQHLSQTLPIPSNPRGIADARKLARAEAQKRKRERRKEAEALHKIKKAEYNRRYRERLKEKNCIPINAIEDDPRSDDIRNDCDGEHGNTIRLMEMETHEPRDNEFNIEAPEAIHIIDYIREPMLHDENLRPSHTLGQTSTSRPNQEIPPTTILSTREPMLRDENLRPSHTLGQASTSRPNQEIPPRPILSTRNLARTSTFNENVVYKLKLGSSVDKVTGRHFLGRMDAICASCKALHWKEEKVKNTKYKDFPFGKCCDHGRVQLPHLKPLPPVLQSLVSGEGIESTQFLKNSRAYNSLFQLASTGTYVKEVTRERGGIGHFRIQGRIYHSIGPLNPEEGSLPRFAQIYIYDTEHELQNRGSLMTEKIDNRTLERLQRMIHEYNPYVRQFRALASSTNDCEMRILLKAATTGLEKGRYNLPSASEVAAILPGDGTEEVIARDIVVNLHGGGVRHISDLNQAYIPLHFVLLFPFGEAGWHVGIQKGEAHMQRDHVMGNERGPPGGSIISFRENDDDRGEELDEEALIENDDEMVEDYDRMGGGRVRSTVTPLEFALFRLHVREDTNDIGGTRLMRFRRLSAEWIVDVWSTIEMARLTWVRTHQTELRAHLYRGIRDAMTRDDCDAGRIGTRIILPATFVGSPRFMLQCYQDAMAIVRYCGKPDYFITMTCNPKWPEIQNELFPGQTAIDRPDLVARVFHQKKMVLLDLIMKKQVLGRVVGHVHTVEFQKRGLPHMHLCVCMGAEDKPRTPLQIDAVISAQIPDSTTHQKLYNTVANCMMHGPCGALNPNAPCMENGKCTKRYPKQFAKETIISSDGTVTYCRPDNGRKVPKKLPNGRIIDLDNRWVVPFNPLFLTVLDCHINVEIVNNVSTIKYLYKYCYKGPDAVMARVSEINRAGETITEPIDEVSQYADARYISSVEGCMRLLKYPLHKESPSVVRLPVHLPEQHTVFFRSSDGLEDILRRGSASPLTEWFQMNADERLGSEARKHLYIDFPKYYTWKNKKWHPRKKNIGGCGPSIGRLNLTHPGEGERHWLRLLLHHIRGATSFEDVRTFVVDGEKIVYPTFKQAAIQLGLLEGDDHHFSCLEECASFKNGRSVRELFAMILVYFEPKEPIKLWNAFVISLTEDLLHAKKQRIGRDDIPLDASIINLALLEVDLYLQDHRRRLSDFQDMPQPTFEASHGFRSLLEEEELSYNREELRRRAEEGERQLNEGQSQIWNVVNDVLGIIRSGQHPQGHIFFVDGLGGTGKTFLYNLLLARVRCEGHIALAVASSGIAALLLEGGRTAHSRFKIPIDVDQDRSCRVNVDDDIAQLIREALLIIWDEAPMCHRHAFEAVNRTFQDVMGRRDLPFGGKLIVLGGDFRQVLPVVRHGNRATIIRATLKRSDIWSHVRVMKLTENMRVKSLEGQAKEEQQAWSKWLLNLGDGHLEVESQFGEDAIRLPDDMVLESDQLIDLINEVYGEDSTTLSNLDFLKGRALLTTRNKDVDDINTTVMDRLLGEERVFLSADSIPDEDDAYIYPTEFLNTILPSGIPPHKLTLKIGAPIMLLRNLNGLRGQVNGTRLVVRGFGHHIIDAEIITGTHIGHRVFIPRIPLIASDSDLPFRLRRLQFPIRPAFAMSINKSQGQTLQKIGLHLLNPVFAHGQLYVACSRVGKKDCVKIMLDQGADRRIKNVHTRNIVYPEILI